MRLLHSDTAEQAQILKHILLFLCPEKEWAE